MPFVLTFRRLVILTIFPLAVLVVLSACAQIWSKLSDALREGSYTLVVMKKEQLTSTPNISEYPTGWSPDGRQIAFTGFLGRLGMEKVYLGLLTLDNGQVVRTTQLLEDASASGKMDFGAGKDYGGYWSPDGKKIAFFSNRGGNYDIWVTNINSTGLAQLTTHEADDLYPTWSPDGKKIAFLSSRSGEVSVWTMNNNGSDQEQITAGGNGDWGTDWSPDGMEIMK